MDFSLVTNRNLSKILPFSSLGSVSDEVDQSGLKVLHFWCHSPKIGNPKPKIFLHCWLDDLPSLLRVWTAF